MELADGVHTFDLTMNREGEQATFYPGAVETDRGLLLLDVGYPATLDQLESQLRDIGHDWSTVWAALITHQDPDHAGALSAVTEKADPLLFAHSNCAPYVDGRRDLIKGGDDRYPPVPIDIETPDGASIHTDPGPAEVVYTPGHAPGHVSVYLPGEKLLFAADALTAPGGDLAGPSEEFTPDMAEAIESVGRLAEYDIERTVCFHGGLVEKGTGMIARTWQQLAE
jgi:glyoxylase-like metal-dependent hydrolase (beta-lactamase superfamily II)